jgi:hypothetical protein
MSLILKDRVRETTTVTGTGPATLLGAVTGYQAFSVVGDTNTCYYTIADQSGPNWEVGIGTYSSTGPTLTRTTVLASSNGGSAVNFTSGTKDVFLTYPSENAVYTSNGPGTSGYVLVSAGSGAASVWTAPTSIVGGAGGSNTQVQYNSSGSLAGSANMTFDGTALTLANDASISGLTVGKGGGALGTNTSVGSNALAGTNTVGYNTALGYYSLNATTSGAGLVGVGYTALQLNTTGSGSVAVGNTALYNNTTGSNNVAVGQQALQSNTTASNNTAVGYQAGYSNTTGTGLVAVGQYALKLNTTGSYNTAVGASDNAVGGALTLNTTGLNNSAFGAGSLASNTTGGYNSAFGMQALLSNTTASSNTAVGYQSGYSNVTGTQLTFIGYQAGYANTSDYNTGVGYRALASNTSGNFNVAVGTGAATTTTTGVGNSVLGVNALLSNTTGGSNVAIGTQALNTNTTASNNTAVGYQAGYSSTGTLNTYLGSLAGYTNTTNALVAVGYKAGYLYNTGVESNGSVFVGYQSGAAVTSGHDNAFFGGGSGALITTGSKNTILGAYQGNNGGLDIRTASNYIVLSDGDGNPLAYVQNAVNNWYQKSNSTLWSITSDARIKKNVTSLESGLNVISALRPVEFDYIENDKHDIGFIAQEYQTVLPAQISEGEDGMLSLNQNLVPYLVKAIQELKAEVDSLKQQLGK